MKRFLNITLFLIFTIASAQEQPETEAQFPGGIVAFYKFIGQNFVMPDEAQQKKVDGRIYASFTVSAEGVTENVKIVRDLGMGTATELTQVILASPKWTPAETQGKKVAQTVSIAVPIKATGETTPDSDPVYVDGTEKLYALIGKKIRIPSTALGVSGTTYVSFYVETDGKPVDFRIKAEPAKGMGKALISVLKETTWKPAIKNGIPVRKLVDFPLDLQPENSMQNHGSSVIRNPASGK